MDNTEALEFIKLCVRQRRILWTYHSNMRMRNRFIPRSYIISSVNRYEIIEEYPEDKYLPSYLVYSVFGNRIIHILFAVDFINKYSIIVTAYEPTLEKWMPDYKTRRI